MYLLDFRTDSDYSGNPPDFRAQTGYSPYNSNTHLLLRGLEGVLSNVREYSERKPNDLPYAEGGVLGNASQNQKPRTFLDRDVSGPGEKRTTTQLTRRVSREADTVHTPWRITGRSELERKGTTIMTAVSLAPSAVPASAPFRKVWWYFTPRTHGSPRTSLGSYCRPHPLLNLLHSPAPVRSVSPTAATASACGPLPLP